MSADVTTAPLQATPTSEKQNRYQKKGKDRNFAAAK